MTQLTDKVKELISKARIVSFGSWEKTHPKAAIEIFQMADDNRSYLTDENLQQIKSLSPDSSEFIPVAKLLRDNATEIVDESRKQLLAAMPGIVEPGGGLYPPERAAACWRDFWHFLRCITYGIAAQRTDYTNTVGLSYMEQLYQELQVPLDAMVFGLQSLKTASKQQLAPLKSTTSDDQVDPYFDHLITALSQFQTN